MKKILALILVMLMMALPIVASAEEVEETVPTTEEVTVEVTEEISITETVVEWVKTNIEEIAVIFSLVASAFYGAITRRGLNGSIGTLNNNAITIAENSAKAIKDALAEVGDIADVVKNYKDEINQVNTFLNTSKLACLALSKEVANLILLSNIPQTKKEELYSAHLKMVHELEAAEGVTTNDGEKA